MSLQERPNRTEPIDPSGFLWALQSHYHSLGKADFSFNSQHDAAEVLRVVLEEILSTSVHNAHTISTNIKTSITCSTCFFSFDSLDYCTILPVPLTNSVSESVVKLLSSETLSGENEWLCPICNEHRESSKDTSFFDCGEVLLIELMRYRSVNGDTFKDDRVVNCHPLNLSIPYSSDGEVSLIKEYSLKAIINHSGSAGSGHYWTTLFNKDLNCWLSCDDKSVTRILPDSLNSRYSYVYLYTSN